MDIILIGHRASGKTTLARALGMLHPHLFEVIDLDAIIEQEEERTCAQIIADHEPYFRQLERTYLDRVLALPSPSPHRIIVPGAGCSHLPSGPMYIWLQRDGWVDSANSERTRLRARRSFDEEVAWMKETREPRWSSRAHAVCRITRGSKRELDVQRLSELVLALLQAPDSQIVAKSWLVPHDEVTLERAISDLRTLGLAGLEIRSDFFPTDVDTLAMHVSVLASLRTPDAAWCLRSAPHAHTLDVDVRFIAHAEDTLSQLTPRTLILSAHPDAGTDLNQALDTLITCAQDLTRRHPSWEEHMVLKFAPTHQDVPELLRTLDAMQELATRFKVTYLPQGPEHAWMRPWLVTHLNTTNYMPVTLHAQTTGVLTASQEASPAALDLQEWLPHLTAQPPTRFDALIGDPVHQSMGDWWHRMASLRAYQSELGYLKIPVARNLGPDQWRHMLNVFTALNMRGLSITSPHKRTIARHDDVMCVDEQALDAVNTLKHDERDGWLAIDTDHVGMVATLDELKARGITPGDVALIGQGGVSPAVRRAFDARPAWKLVHHASAREGWTSASPSQVSLVINASGDQDNAYINAPKCEVWVDLHYTGVRTPTSGEVHLNGETFFIAQARAQRQFWDDDVNTTP